MVFKSVNYKQYNQKILMLLLTKKIRKDFFTDLL